MKSVGIRILKNQLSKYLKLVQKGETVLVTDHDEVVAEIRKPAQLARQGLSRYESFILDAEENGVVTASSEKLLLEAPPKFPGSLELAEILDDLRGDRF